MRPLPSTSACPFPPRLSPQETDRDAATGDVTCSWRSSRSCSEAGQHRLHRGIMDVVLPVGQRVTAARARGQVVCLVNRLGLLLLGRLGWQRSHLPSPVLRSDGFQPCASRSGLRRKRPACRYTNFCSSAIVSFSPPTSASSSPLCRVNSRPPRALPASCPEDTTPIKPPAGYPTVNRFFPADTASGSAPFQDMVVPRRVFGLRCRVLFPSPTPHAASPPPSSGCARFCTDGRMRVAIADRGGLMSVTHSVILVL